MPDPALVLLGRVHLLPVRHHSPRTTAVVLEALERVRPALVLVEGPSDANALIDVLVDPETVPPVAILGYRTDGTPSSSLWPFASYSPELAALRWARENGAKAAFIDVPVGQVLAAGVARGAAQDQDQDEGEEQDQDGRQQEEEEGGEGDAIGIEGSEAPDVDGERGPVSAAIARARGFRSFEEFWEASFEAPAYAPAAFREVLLAYAELVRSRPDPHDHVHRARDAYMTERIVDAAGEGIAPERIAVVVGAAHAAAFAAGDVDLGLVSRLPAPVATAVTVIPYSFPRLAEQTGYGAGNRAPRYYQRAHDAGCDFRRATLEVLIDFSEHLRLRGFMASLADVIEAYRLACTLSDLRGKAAPGLDEVREATVATMCRGDASHVDGFLWSSVVGHSIGKVAAKVGKNSLQEEFWREIDARHLPRTDSPEIFVLKLNDEVQVRTSIFLHRLRVGGIPYANYQGTQMAGGRPGAPEAAGGIGALSRVKESWEAQWTPSTDVALVERIVLGDSLQQVCERTLRDRLAVARTTGAVADVLMEAVVTACPEALSLALAACDEHAATDDDLPSLARACRALSGLVSYGTSRGRSTLGDEAIPELCRKTFGRAVLRVAAGCMGTDDAVEPAKDALRTLHEVALAQPLVDKESWLAAARTLLESYAVNPSCSGLACGLLYLAQAIDEAAVTAVVGQRLSNILEPERAASFIEGFLRVNALVLVKNRPIVEALDAFLTAIERERFRDALPLLRRAFGPLGPTERRYLLENLLAVRKLGDKARAAAAVLVDKDKDKLKQMSEDISKAMDDLDDLL